MHHCVGPPPLRTLNVVEVGETFAALQWNTTIVSHNRRAKKQYYTTTMREESKHTKQFSYSLSWETQDEIRPENYYKTTLLQDASALSYLNPAKSNIVLPADQTNVVVAGLSPKTYYLLSIFAFNECAQTAKLALQIATRAHGGKPPNGQVLADVTPLPATTLLPHEFILLLFVMLLWLTILYRFFKIYRKITCVSVLPTVSSPTPENAIRKFSEFSDKHCSRDSQAHKLSNVSGQPNTYHTEESYVSKSSAAPLNQFELLEDAVCTWRSETLLSTKLNRDQHPNPILSQISQNMPRYKKSTCSMSGVPHLERLQNGALAYNYSAERNRYNGSCEISGNTAKSFKNNGASVTTLASYPVPKVMVEHETDMSTELIGPVNKNILRRESTNSTSSQSSAVSMQLPNSFSQSHRNRHAHRKKRSSERFGEPARVMTNASKEQQGVPYISRSYLMPMHVSHSMPTIQKSASSLSDVETPISEKQTPSSLQQSNNISKIDEDMDTFQPSLNLTEYTAMYDVELSDDDMPATNTTALASPPIQYRYSFKENSHREGRRKSNYALRMYTSEEGPIRRKVSDVLLGKATKDIRRRSTLDTNAGDIANLRQMAGKSSFRRRLSSFGSSLPRRFSLKRKNHQDLASRMSSLQEEHESSPVSNDKKPS